MLKIFLTLFLFHSIKADDGEDGEEEVEYVPLDRANGPTRWAFPSDLVFTLPILDCFSEDNVNIEPKVYQDWSQVLTDTVDGWNGNSDDDDDEGAEGINYQTQTCPVDSESRPDQFVRVKRTFRDNVDWATETSLFFNLPEALTVFETTGVLIVARSIVKMNEFYLQDTQEFTADRRQGLLCRALGFAVGPLVPLSENTPGYEPDEDDFESCMLNPLFRNPGEADFEALDALYPLPEDDQDENDGDRRRRFLVSLEEIVEDTDDCTFVDDPEEPCVVCVTTL